MHKLLRCLIFAKSKNDYDLNFNKAGIYLIIWTEQQDYERQFTC